MPRGRPRKVDPEILSPEDEQPRGRKKLVEAEHTIKYSAPVPVTVEETPEDELMFEEDVEDVERKRKRKTSRDEREELRRDMDKLGVAPLNSLKLTIEKYKHSDSTDSGTTADKDYCTRYACTKEHILNGDFLDVARRWGAGRYWLTLRLQNRIVREWDREISAPASQMGTVIQNAIPGDPTSPQVIVQMPDGQSPTVFDPVRAMKEQTLAFKQQLENYKLMRDVFGPVVETSQQTGNPDPDTAFVQSLLADNTKLKEKISNGLIGQILGDKAVTDDPSWGSVLMKGIEKGEVSKAIDSIGRIAVTLLDMILPKRSDNNGQTQMAQTPLQTSGTVDSQRREFRTNDQTQTQQEGLQGIQPGNGEANNEGGMLPTASPEDQALQLVIDHCQKKIPVQIAFNRLMAYADAVNEQYPQGSIDGYIDLFGAMTPEQALDYVKTLPNGETVVALDHAKEWTNQLQKLIRDSQEEQ